MSTPNHWIRSPPRASGRIKLFCFAHAGGGAGFFHPWVRALAPDIEVHRIVLPGRESRRHEPAISSMSELVPLVASALQAHATGPYALFGHSMGAAIAYEVARWMSTADRTPPVHLFVSGRRAPHLPARRDPFHLLPDPDLLRLIQQLNGTPSEVFESRDLMSEFLPCLRADFKLNETYQPVPGVPLHCGVTGLAGDGDPEVDFDELFAWGELTTGPFESRLFEGDHFYLNTRQEQLLSELSRRLVRATDLFLR
ncbi:MAG: alpha/beta fold hydrolase [Myxococcota bacterium]